MTDPTPAVEGPDAQPGPGAPLRLAVVEADPAFLRVLTNRLDRLGWEHRVLASAPPADALVAMRLNALVVDLAVLGPTAWDDLARLCRELPNLPIVVCSGPSTVAQRVRGLRLGADDWLTRPCHPEELIARVEAVVRRRRAVEAREEGPLVAGELAIRPDRFQAYVGDASVELTRREFELIELLAAAGGRVLEREEIYQRVWGYAMARGDRSVDVFVRKLRQKLEKASPGWKYIHTHFGVGYRFAAEPADEDGPAIGASPAADEVPAGGPGPVPAGGPDALGSGGREAAAAARALESAADSSGGMVVFSA
jgi:DNA-binding response OmpR family regulator